MCVSVCVLSRLEGITNGRRAASKSKSGSGARWVGVSSLRDWVKRRSTCANGGFDIDSDGETDTVRGHTGRGRYNESNVSRPWTNTLIESL